MLKEVQDLKKYFDNVEKDRYHSYTDNYDFDFEEIRLEEPDIDQDFTSNIRNYAPINILYPDLDIRKASGKDLGNGVLGICIPTYGVIRIREDLEGNDLKEVLAHEINHYLYPDKPEYEIRGMTRNQLYFSPRWH